MSADEIQTGSAKAERAKAILLKEFFTSSGRVPELEGNLFYKEQGEKKTWKKAYFMLRSSGIYYSTKGKTRESHNLVCFVNFDGHNLYMGIDFKKQFKAPNNFCFALKPDKVSTSVIKELRCLCGEDQETMLSWTAGIRLAKFGLQLRDNYMAIQRKHNKLKEQQQAEEAASRRPLGRRASAPALSPTSPHQTQPTFFASATTDPLPPRHSTSVLPHPSGLSSVSSLRHERTIPEADENTNPPPLPPVNSESPGRKSPFNKPRFKKADGPHVSQSWFFGALGREEAVEILLKNGNMNGLFLVRESSNCPGAFVLTMAHDGRARHFQIQQRSVDPLKYSIDDGPIFPDVVQVIKHYSSDPDRLPCRLTKSCSRPTYRKIGD
jgi:hypothetical protein